MCAFLKSLRAASGLHHFWSKHSQDYKRNVNLSIGRESLENFGINCVKCYCLIDPFHNNTQFEAMM